MITVTVKWGKQKLENVEMDTAGPIELFKAQLYTLTQVPPERQKIMGVKGGPVKDDANWQTLGVKQGQVLMLMGTADKLADPPPVATVFAEDLPAAEVASGSNNPGGLSNLGNTCYLNSSLQCLRVIPEVSTCLQRYEGKTNSAANSGVVTSMRDLVSELERSSAAVEVRPFKFVGIFRQAFPMFAQQAEGGRGFVQQDAEECWSTLITLLAQHLKLPGGAGSSDLAAGQPELLPRTQTLRANLGDELFGVEMQSSYRCLESDAEQPYTVAESARKISCHISDKTAHLYNAVENALEETVEKNSPLLGRDVQYSKKSRISRLPPYLAVQFVRFAWRKDTNKRAKILRSVSFPDVLDVRNMCTDELQASIAANVNRLEAIAEEEAAAKKPKTAAEAPSEAVPMQTDDKPMAEVAAAPAVADAPVPECHSLECDNRTGKYELYGIITHQGRTAEGGHYVAWLKKDKKKWLVFDDETVAEVDTERIKELYGGGDWHIAYVCLYRKMDKLSLD